MDKKHADVTSKCFFLPLSVLNSFSSVFNVITLDYLRFHVYGYLYCDFDPLDQLRLVCPVVQHCNLKDEFVESR